MESSDTPNIDSEVPPLDVVDSKWWYLIAAYPIVFFLFVPVFLIGGLLIAIPVIIMGPGIQPARGLVALGAIFGILLAIIIVVMIMLTFALVVTFPIALYLDARAITDADIDWAPDPLLYGLLGVLQLIVTPLIGIIIAIYYLYRRHQTVGVP